MSQNHHRTFSQRVLDLFANQSSVSSDDAFDQLMRRLNTLDERLAALTDRSSFQHDDPSAALPFHQLLHRVEVLDERLAALTQQPQTSSQVQSDDQVAAIQTALAGVEKQIMRSGREQLKANALVEAQQEQLRAALEALEEADARREEALEAIQAQASTREAAARLEVAQRILPALDGLDEALRAGDALLVQPAVERPQTLMERLLLVPAPASSPEDQRLRDALRAWLHGLTFVRQRLLDTLATEQVRPIAALGTPFDPHLHIALQAVPADDGIEPGTVVAELRRGYTVGSRVLRHAEVAVAQAQIADARG